MKFLSLLYSCIKNGYRYHKLTNEPVKIKKRRLVKYSDRALYIKSIVKNRGKYPSNQIIP